MKYGRPVSHGDGPGITRLIDVVTIPEPLPSWADDAPSFLAIQFPTLTGFVRLLDGVQPCARHTGEDYADPASYLNPDGSDGDGVFPPEPEPEEGE